MEGLVVVYRNVRVSTRSVRPLNRALLLFVADLPKRHDMKNINRSKRKILLLYPRSSFRNILSEDHCHFQCIFCRSCKFRSSLVTDRYVYSRATDSISKHALIKRATLIGCRGHLKSGGHRCSESASSMISVPPWNVRQQTYI